MNIKFQNLTSVLPVGTALAIALTMAGASSAVAEPSVDVLLPSLD